MKKENIFLQMEKKMEKEKEENIWRRKILFAEEKKIREGKYLEKEKILSAEERKHAKGK